MPRARTAGSAEGSTAMQAMIAERAYFKAEQRGFAPGLELDDWLAAERELTSAAPGPTPRRKTTAATGAAKRKPAKR